MSGFVSFLCLGIVGVLCAIGCFHSLYKDGLLERLGMGMVGVWALLRAPVRLEALHTEPANLMLHIGLASFALGMAAAKYRHRHTIAATPSQPPASATWTRLPAQPDRRA